ncbi:BBT_HP_G0012110.mRNA.1.CDS.1 [Saccharomyces cerevisiae]|nr:BBT_HP_G0038060.mRNA.1.CDS.1 [Saccharomyces cerevisiae]CAI4997925.1 BBT_HP_G0078130.mRNA.1.CDS.1 [Saccharomyces cerevisiae]CAI5207151.1 BBT_HP_G0012110.mRNA.1.CDS.1 [Saccharomyces cerevisiae]CAI6536223.1 BBT_HP_G0038060.mRNA.1.CDS.1 [Saccharomyces cerevisiae]CAI6888716.1 BBT_HP_G0078130.mRNA.1.CDS.1 [Saccharomyces cerevisiae]
MSHLITLATCNLNQWALDFEGNRDRILQSIKIAKERGARLRVGPELEITGYGCLDHFLENDVCLHSWEMYAQIIKNKETHGLILDIGMPVLHKNVRYNCRLLSLDGEILFIRPKVWLANDGNYREMRFFTPWMKPGVVEDFILPPEIQKVTGQRLVPFGDAVINSLDTCIGTETCEELFTPQSPHIAMSLDGVEIMTNSSGSHHELRKLNKRLDLILNATKRCGGVYLYANQRGCDGDRLYYDGCALIAINGTIVAQGSQFSLDDVEVVTATVDLEEVRSYRAAVMSRGLQASLAEIKFKRIDIPVELALMTSRFDPTVCPTKVREPFYHSPEEEIALGPACWMWDYLRRCNGTGFFLPLSGGIDSCATAMIVHSMCRLVTDAAQNGNEQVIKDVRKITRSGDDWIPDSPQDLASKIFHSCFMGTENSSKETRNRAKDLSNAIGSYHVDLKMDSLVSSVVSLFEVATGKKPIYKIFGGSQIENLALQNIQARLRMVLSYLFAQLLPWVRGIPNSGGLLVLGSANVDECLRGYLTKYDCSSADINPIGGISKTDLKRFIAYASKQYNMPILNDFLNATPTAELEPMTKDYVQSDEIDMGMTYEELGVFGYLRKVEKCGPYSMFLKLLHQWSPKLTPRQISEKVKRFFFFYAINRHKQTVLTPSYHAEQYSPEDNRFDLRPFLINPRFPWASRKIDEVVEQCEAHKGSTLDIMSID